MKSVVFNILIGLCVCTLFCQCKKDEKKASSPEEIVAQIEKDMIKVDSATFTMGATPDQGAEASHQEKPAHKVTLSPYSIGKTEVTQAQWNAVMGTNPSANKGNNYPVENVSWDDCQQFIAKLNQMTGKNYRLPTEAEWEFACRGGSKSTNGKYSGGDKVLDHAWFALNKQGRTHEVATKEPNELGIYDMSGNVAEWCSDGFGMYTEEPQTNPTGVDTNDHRVFRGGNWHSQPKECRSAYRNCKLKDFKDAGLGFRLVLPAK